eukprot:403363481
MENRVIQQNSINRPNTAAVNQKLQMPLQNNLTAASTPGSPRQNRLSFHQQVQQRISQNGSIINTKTQRPSSQNVPVFNQNQRTNNIAKPSQLIMNDFMFNQSQQPQVVQQNEDISRYVKDQRKNINLAASPPSIQNTNTVHPHIQPKLQGQNAQVLNILKQMNVTKATPGKDGNIKFNGKLQIMDHYRTYDKDKVNATLDNTAMLNQSNDANIQDSLNNMTGQFQRPHVSNNMLRSYDFRMNKQNQKKALNRTDLNNSEDENALNQPRIIQNGRHIKKISNNFIKPYPQTQQNSPESSQKKFISISNTNQVAQPQQRQPSLNSSNNFSSPNSSGIPIINDQDKNVVYKKASSYFSQPSSPKQQIRPTTNKANQRVQIRESYNRVNSQDTRATKEIIEKPPQDERYNVITKFAFATTVGFMPGNPHKQNQDSFTLSPNLGGVQGLHYFVVADGHGVNGHHVSGYIKEKISNLINQFYNSGSTCCSVLFDMNTLFVANCGDSRAMMCSYSPKSGIKITSLSQDHKPSLPEEMSRIKQSGGRVETIKGPNNENWGPERVWLMHEDSPGLAMSRSLGDNQAHLIGVIPDPDVMKYDLTPDDKFIVIASDGVFEFLENEQVAELIWPYFVKHSPEAAGNALVRAAAQKWKENDTVIDDITCIIIFMEVD